MNVIFLHDIQIYLDLYFYLAKGKDLAFLTAGIYLTNGLWNFIAVKGPLSD